ncbi:hypothetical protein HanRHA438_Chr08g0328101 [Helianthus annuus]|uniref:Uncharacterized protein n=1 Tax=Helianthus annuus TaxID=4232 RepID=A0A9K3IBJ1_HELAN|nr:hypothetical protein HanXRQr2_Chr08g0318091 [Helianthus annuus]KAJ0895870.1 hypothetical protein HanRHA438_Chr08g0328101 [Helianthus annuus]KAJ0899900.1 hypothetical protein HanPSC8_Chr08g0307371 [Helianthus annuus]
MMAFFYTQRRDGQDKMLTHASFTRPVRCDDELYYAMEYELLSSETGCFFHYKRKIWPS